MACSVPVMPEPGAGLAQLSDPYVAGVTFTQGLAEGDCLDDVEFEGCTFSALSLHKARLRRCAFLDCDFEGVNLSMVDLVDSSFNDCRVTGSKALGVSWCTVRGSALAAVPVRFSRCVLDYGVFNAGEHSGWVFESCSLREADFTGADLRRARLVDCDLAGARFVETDLREATLVDSYNYRFDVRANRTTGLRVILTEAAELLTVFGIVTTDPDQNSADGRLR